MTDETTTDIPAEAWVFGGSHVHVVNNETGGEWDCPADYYPIAVTRGWAAAAPAAPDYTALFDPGTGPGAGEVGGEPEETGFNPDDHTVADVNAYLDGLGGESPGEVARVLEAEAAGQARKGILHGPHGTPEPDTNDASNS